MPKARGPWALDSGGFTQLQNVGAWTITANEYAARVRRYHDQIGMMTWAAPQDWMCEPAIIHGGQFGTQKFVGTHLSVFEHQKRTVANLCDLRHTAPDLPWTPVLQGYTLQDYVRCIAMYGEAGVDLSAEPIVGIGSVCRREATLEIRDIITAVREAGVHNIHGFGVKRGGIEGYGDLLTSADSMAWSYRARRQGIRLPGHRHANCAYCLPYALQWRAGIVDESPGPLEPAAPAGVTKLPAASDPPAAAPGCETCGSVIPQRSTGRPARHCSHACRQRAYRARVATVRH